MDERALMDKLRKIEALIARPGTTGEEMAATEARQRLLDRLEELQKQNDPAVEFRFSLPDDWSRRLFLALLKKYNLKPYRYPGQRHMTVAVRAPQTFVKETLRPEFEELSRVLRGYLEEVTNRMIDELFEQK